MKLGSYIFSTLLIILLIFNSTKATLTYAYYNLDPMGFIEALCENKDKPELACNGKCQLKKVAESQDKNQNTPESIVDFKQLIFYPNEITDFAFLNIIISKKQQPTSYLNLYTFSKSYDYFHPPRV